ncbi:MAG: Rdx family protein [Cyclobacteriaceae bacterium]|nr:Rdx family protein [Cyclobacteriaceae bacterium HetDA_MAG_MS6]
MNHHITIEYCTRCNWMHRATWMTQELFTTFQEELDSITLKQGTGGIYDIYLNQELLFSRKKEERFPEITEIKRLIRDHIAPDRSLGHTEKKA